MSLRTQIHDAIDEVAPPAPQLEQRVADFVFASPQRRATARRRLDWTRRFRGLTTLVAAALVLVLVSGLFVAGRIWRDLNAPPPTINQAALKTLEGRPLNFLPVPPGSQCPVTPVSLYGGGVGLAVGSGPLALIDKEAQQTTTWGAWAVYSFAVYPYPTGPVLIRATDLERNAQVVFAKSPLGPSLIMPAGRVVGTDELSGRNVQMRSEAVFQLGLPPSPGTKSAPFKYLPLFVMVGVHATGSNCIGLRFDGQNFTETIVVDFSSFGL